MSLLLRERHYARARGASALVALRPARLPLLGLLGHHRLARRLRAEPAAAVDHAARGVLVGEPPGRAVLRHARLAVVADAVGVDGLQALPLVVGERDVVVVAAQRLELAVE